MKFQIHKIISIKITGPNSLQLEFEDGLVKNIDFYDVLNGPLLSELKSADYFARVELDPESGTIHWPNGVDFDPAILYDWDHYKTLYKERTAEWNSREKAHVK